MLLPIIILLAIDLYAFQAIRTVLIDSPTLKLILTIVYWMISIALYIGAIAIMQREFNTTTLAIRIVFGAIITFAVAKLFIVLFLLAEDSVRLVKWAVHQLYTQPITGVKQHGITRSQFISKIGLLAGGFMLGSFVWGMVKTAYNYKVRKVSVPLAQLKSSFTGLKIVQISDLHLGSFIGTEAIEHAVKIINKQQADVIFFTGDLVNAHATEAESFIPVLSQLKAKYGVYSTLGNHDYYGTEADLARIKTIHTECGWTILNNDHRVLEIDDQKIAIVGVENWGESRHFPKMGDLDKACQGCEEVDVKLLLSHDPSHWNYVVSQNYKDIDITFSGHTHGFQFGIEIPQLKIKWSPSQYAYKQWAGLYSRGKQHLYVNRGLGFIGFHGRVGIPPEITVMDVVGKV